MLGLCRGIYSVRFPKIRSSFKEVMKGYIGYIGVLCGCTRFSAYGFP